MVDLYRRMCVEWDYAPVLRTAVEDCGIRSDERAVEALDGFLQWFAVLPSLASDCPYVMMKGDVDNIFHAFILNTGMYRAFCDRYIGEFVDHTPVMGVTPPEWVDRTVDVLDQRYGDRLSPEFRRWRAHGANA